ncbi:hypothetical protein [Clostridium perfringens]|uniref:hypothetical protein n=1 Tax=Clostridium perfringens TaxID=1502 RepID=UPI0029799921|nr:hypothetical protein [Clostridium perfringens]MDM0781756.1 hypothetical protein [Clostridium perfringens]MDM0867353.1 hypothetical protein [Clostridium perfringens]MDM0875255.1 hypothetical protein [Clostridium perfringens]MDM0878164.1 hypothetical protein [Clostridium perfringens]
MNTFQEIQDILNDDLIVFKTGEIIKGSYIKTALKTEISIKKGNKLRGLIYKKTKENSFKKASSLLGGKFYSLHYTNIINLPLNQPNLNTAFTFRLIYLCSYLNYDNILVTDNLKRSKTKYINEKDLGDILKLSKKQIQDFKKICFANNILEKISIYGVSAIKVNINIACLGTIPNSYKRNSIRISIPHIQSVYHMSSAREHKQLGYLIPLLPYIHYEFSILANNPNEQYEEYIQPLSLQDICKILNYSRTNSGKLLTLLRKFTLNNRSLFLTGIYKNKKIFFLNPELFLKSSTPTSLKHTLNLLKLSETYEDK